MVEFKGSSHDGKTYGGTWLTVGQSLRSSMSRVARVPGSRGGFRVARPGTPVAQMMSVAYPGEPDGGKGFDGQVCAAVIVLVVAGFWLANTNRGSGGEFGALLILCAPVVGFLVCCCRSCNKSTTPYMDKLASAQEPGSGAVWAAGGMGMAIGD